MTAKGGALAGGTGGDAGAGPRLAGVLRAAAPRLLYGLRMMGSVALAMWVAFWLELQHAYWAPLTAAIVCQPTIGASLRKGQFRVIGTVAGATAITALTGLMPQSRVGLAAGLIAWAMLAGAMATLLRNAAAYAASLGGYTAVIVFADAVGGSPVETFTLAVTRATEISIGVLSAGLVLAATDTGDARRRLARDVAEIAAGIAAALAESASAAPEAARERRRALIGRLVSLDPLIDEALGETADLRIFARTLRNGVEGLVRAISASRAIMDHREAAGAAGAAAPPGELDGLDRIDWLARPGEARGRCEALARGALGREARTVSERLLADRGAEALLGLGRTANAVALLVRPRDAVEDRRPSRIHVPDVLPVLVNAFRVGVAALAATAIWIEIPWPGGQGALTFACVVTILFAPQAERAVGIVRDFGLGVTFAAFMAGLAEFAVLPDQQSFLALILVIAAVMVPAAAMAAGTWHRFFFTAITFIFLALLAPANRQTYDLADFLNQALGIVVGIVLALIAFRAVPPPGPDLRMRRLLALTLRDTRRLAAGRARRGRRDWLGLISSRVAAMPEDAAPLDRARLIAGFSAGNSVLRLEGARGLAEPAMLARALDGLAAGDVATAIGFLERLEAAQPRAEPALRDRAEILALRDVLARHARFFAGDAA